MLVRVEDDEHYVDILIEDERVWIPLTVVDEYARMARSKLARAE